MLGNITPEAAAILLEADAALGLKESIKNGKLQKPLPAATRKKLQAIANRQAAVASDQDLSTARNKRELAHMLGVTAPTLYKYMRLTGFPKPLNGDGKYNVERCRLFMKSRGWEGVAEAHGPAGTRGGNEKDNLPYDRRVKAERDEIKRDKERVEFETLIGERLLADDVNAAIRGSNAAVVRELSKVFVHELPPVLATMDDGAEIADLIERKLMHVLSMLPKQFEKKPRE